MKIHELLFLVLITLSGCATSESPLADETEASDSLSICELAASGLVEGQTARVVAIYRSDTSHYAYLFNEGCGQDGILNVEDMEPISEETLRNFYAAIDERCAENDALYICVAEVKIDADILVSRSQDGRLAAEILKVHQFSVLEPETVPDNGG